MAEIPSQNFRRAFHSVLKAFRLDGKENRNRKRKGKVEEDNEHELSLDLF